MDFRWALAAATLAASACSNGTSQLPPFKPIVDTGSLMESFIEPSADVIWLSVGTIVSAAGEEHIRPKTEEEWTKVKNAAVAVSEIEISKQPRHARVVNGVTVTAGLLRQCAGEPGCARPVPRSGVTTLAQRAAQQQRCRPGWPA